jgi:hypothetical protein
VLFAEARLQQEWIDHYERDDFNLERTDFLRDTDAQSDMALYRAGFTVSPWRPVLFEANVKQRRRESQYDHRTDAYPPADPVGGYYGGDFSGNGYGAFITNRDLDTDELELKLVLRPVRWMKSTLRYQWVGTDFWTRTDRSVFTGFDPDTFDPVPVPQPGGDIFAGNFDAHVYSLNWTLSPWRRWTWSTTVSLSDARTVTGVNGRAGVVPYEGDIWTVLSSSSFVINPKTDWTASYVFSRSDYGQNNVTDGLPAGLVFSRHGALTGLSRRFSKSLRGHIQYGLFAYDDASYSGLNNYTAHAIMAGMTWVMQ